MQRKKITDNFNSAAPEYDRYARVQAQTAARLNQIIPDKILVDKKSVLEIGCGTGLLTELVSKRMKSGVYVCNDVSSQMLAICKQRIGDDVGTKFSYIAKDAGCLSLPGLKFDLITSNAVFQWIDDLAGFFIRLHGYLDSGGMLIFCMFIDGTLLELQESIAHGYERVKQSPQNHMLTFRNEQEITDSLQQAGFTIEESSVEDFVLDYKDPLTVLHALRATGTAHFHREMVPLPVMRLLLRYYQNKFKQDDGSVSCTYRALFCRVRV